VPHTSSTGAIYVSAVTAERLESLCEVCEAYVEDHPAHENDIDIAKCMRDYQELLAASQWQLIETAPKGGGANVVTDPAWIDAPLILLLFEKGKQAVARWDWYYALGGIGHDPRYGEHGAWIEPLSGERAMLHYDPPTHWRPLPAAYTPTERAGG
jgi:hypothetical protein